MENQVTPKKILDVRFFGSFSVLYQGGGKHLPIYFLPFFLLYVQNYLLEMIKNKNNTGHQKPLKNDE
jgi:hypothetical protein